MGHRDDQLVIRSYDAQADRLRVEELQRRCEVGANKRLFLFTDTLGDPLCRIRNSPLFTMLVAELGNELVAMIQGIIKLVTVHNDPPKWTLSKVGYVLGLRVSPLHRRRGIGSRLVGKLEEWFRAHNVDYAYMATEKDNEASFRLFVNKFGYIRFRTPAILVNPVNHARFFNLPSDVSIRKLKVEEAESLYRRVMESTEFFPHDFDRILWNKLSLGTWVAYPRGESLLGNNCTARNWAMLSVWNSGALFKLRLGKAPLSCLIYTKISSKWIGKYLPCLGLRVLPDFFQPFGFYFIFGVHREGPMSGKLVRALCHYVHNMATREKDCKIVVTEVGGVDRLRNHIPHWELLSCPEDMWCIKPLKNNINVDELTKSLPRGRPLFVDPREV